MSDDRFNFDDDLPDWLKGDDSEANSPSEDNDLGIEWQSGEKAPSGADSSRLGVTGELPWRQDVSDPNDPRRPSSLEDLEWDNLDDSSASALGNEDDNILPDWLLDSDQGTAEAEAIGDDDDFSVAPAEAPDWLGSRDEDGPEEMLFPDADEEEAAVSVPDWLQSDDEIDRSAAVEAEEMPVSSLVDEDEGDLPGWLLDMPEGGDEAEGIEEEDFDDFADAFAESVAATDDLSEEDSSLDLKRITSEQPYIRKLGQKDEPRPEDMTFEEWERYQQQKEYEQQHADEIELESEVPDWFRDNVELGDADRDLDSILMAEFLDDDEKVAETSAVEEEALITDSSYVPEWFLGLEEQQLDDAPDWLRDATATTDISGLTDTSAFELPPELEESPEPEEENSNFFDEFVSSDLPEDQDDVAYTGDALGLGELFEDELAPSESMQTEDEEPDWLSGIGASTATAESEEDRFAEMFESGASDEADWLGELSEEDFAQTEDGADSAFAAQPPSAATVRDSRKSQAEDSGELDDVLSSILGESSDPNSQMVVDENVRQVLAQESSADISDLFEGVDDEFLEALSSAEPLGEVREQGQVATAGVFEGPDWVEDLRPDEKVRLGAGGIELEFDQLALSNLPENVRQLRETTLDYVRESSETASEEVVESGTLAGVSGGLGVLQPEPPEDIMLPVGITISDQQAQRIHMLDEALEVARGEMGMSDEEEAAEAAAKPRRRRRRQRRANLQRAKFKPDRFLIAVIVLAAVIAPFFLESLHIGDDPDLDNLEVAQLSLLAGVDALQPGDRVLVAFEYGPTAAGELNPLAEAVLRDVISQGAVPVLISTNPLGSLNGRYVMQSLSADEVLMDAIERDRLVAGQDYYALRYLAGGAVAIRALTESEATVSFLFATDSTGELTNLDIGVVDAQDFAMLLVVGETSDDIRNWAEQFDVEGLPKFALVTTATEPIASAYYDEDLMSGYVGYLAGYRDTYRYNMLRNANIRQTPPEYVEDLPDSALSQWHSLTIGALVAASLIALGTLVNLLRSSIRRRR